MADDNRTTEQISITVDKRTKKAIDLILTPSGLFKPPKGAYSQLINGLLNGYMEMAVGSDMMSILDYIDANPECTLDELKTGLRELGQLNPVEPADEILGD